MALAAGRGAKPAVKVAAGGQVRHGSGDVGSRQAIEQPERRQRAVGEARVHLTPFVPGKAAVRPLQPRYVCKSNLVADEQE